jgi:pimeloyl-ACP methyl ester carboxylesterase
MAAFVLIHGAYQGGWIWKPVATRLRAAGHLVLAPSLEGCGERRHQVRPGITVGTQAQEVAGLLFHEDLTDVVLVGTSSGGMVACRVADLVPERIGRLVFVDALALFPGERVDDVVARPAGTETDLTVAPTRDAVEGRMFAELGPELRAWVVARWSPHPRATLEAPMELDDFWRRRWTATVIWCRRSPRPAQSHQRRTAETLRAAWREIDAGHYPMLSAPDELTRLLTAFPE